jgi:hypothetical protein
VKQLILFSQAPADIAYVVSLYEENKEKYKIKIIVVNVMNNFKFLLSLNLKAEVEYVPVVGKKNLLLFLLFFIRLRTINIKLFNKINRAEVYYFSNTMDYVTAFFIEKLSFKNSVYFVDIYKIEAQEIFSLKSSLSKLIIRFLIGIKVKFFYYNTGGLAYQYISDKNRVSKKILNLNKKKLSHYQHRIITHTKKKKLLLFEGSGVTESYYINYEKALKACIEELSKKYKIYIKPHPRIGYSDFLVDCKVNFVEDYIPSEFIFLNSFDTILGIESAAIATADHPNKYSIIDIFEFNDKSVKIKFKEYLNNINIGSLIFISDVRKI